MEDNNNNNNTPPLKPGKEEEPDTPNPPSKRDRDFEIAEDEVIVLHDAKKRAFVKGSSKLPTYLNPIREPAGWHIYACANPDLFPEVSDIYDWNINRHNRTVNLAQPESRENFYLTPTGKQYVKACWLIETGQDSAFHNLQERFLDPLRPIVTGKQIGRAHV